jgi:arylformamidase
MNKGKSVMALVAYEKQYNDRLRVPEHAKIQAAWIEQAQAYRTSHNAKLDIAYGPSERNKFDLFHPETLDDDTPLALFIHGGYWQSRDRKMFSHVAKGLNNCGFSVAIPSYDLCPNTSVPKIISQMRMCVASLWKSYSKKPVVFGHSAGGHLAACLVSTDWTCHQGLPQDLITKGCALGGIFDLAPLRGTTKNDALKLSKEDARLASPIFRPVAKSAQKFIAVTGEFETHEFHRQADALAKFWNAQGVETETLEIPGANHFTILEEMLNPESPVLQKVIGNQV